MSPPRVRFLGGLMSQLCAAQRLRGPASRHGRSLRGGTKARGQILPSAPELGGALSGHFGAG
ncbi:MAG TPA: hypothetical protein VN255_06820, partial [Mycobacterium sp.]|nr:hypothetical protein [Mycobacterium sp.]